MSENDGVLRQISWRDLCPWLLIFRTFRISVGLPVLLLAVAGALLTPIGWFIGERIFIGNEEKVEALATQDPGFHRVVQRNHACPCDRPLSPLHAETINSPLSQVSALPRLWYQRFVAPFANLFGTHLTLGRFAYLLFGGIWLLAVWSFFGGAITRIAAMQLGREERVGLVDAVKHACRKWAAFMTAPILPAIGVAALGTPIAVLGLFMLGDWGVFVAGIFWILALLAGFLMAIILLGLMFGWPLMWGTISTEGTDAFDALSRSYAYTFQRPLHYLFYGLVAAGFGLLCWTFVFYFSEAVINLTYWGASWGANLTRYWGDEPGNVSRMVEIRQMAESNEPGAGPWLIYACVSLVRTFATAFTYSFFWCVGTAIYLLLRQDVDQTELDEVWADDDGDQYQLPPIKPDKDGVPELDKQRPEGSSSDSDVPSSSGESPVEDPDASPSDIPAEDGDSTSDQSPS